MKKVVMYIAIVAISFIMGAYFQKNVFDKNKTNDTTQNDTEDNTKKQNNNNKEKAGTPGLEYTQKGGSYEVTGYKGSSVDIYIPSTYNGIKVTSVGSRALEDLDIQTLTIAEGVESVGIYCVQRCTLLKKVELPSTLKQLNGHAFDGCMSLETVTFPNGNSVLVEIDTSVFSGCSKLKAFDIPKSVKTIGLYAFARCTSIKTITVPGDVTSLGSTVFDKWTSDQSIVFEKELTGNHIDKDWDKNCEAKITIGGKAYKKDSSTTAANNSNTTKNMTLTGKGTATTKASETTAKNAVATTTKATTEKLQPATTKTVAMTTKKN